MTEPKDIQESLGVGSSEYLSLISSIEKNPHSPEVWDKVLNLAKGEEGTEKSKAGFYGHIPLEEMMGVAERLRDARTLEEKYKILAEKCFTGELWYDIILGRTNDQSLVVLGEEISNWKNKIGEKVSERKWKRGLDIGSGPGNSLREIKRHVENFVGLDRLDFLLQVARSHPELSKAQVVRAEALNLPFADEKFDLVISNGLTYYLTKEDLPKFVDEVAKVLEPGGSYFEAFTYKDKEEILPFVEREFLKSGKSVLACLMDRLITHRDEEAKEGPSHFSILKSGFEERGFICLSFSHRDRGVLVLEFRKKFPTEIDNIRTFYLMGETAPAQRRVDLLIYGQATREISLSGKYSRAGVIGEGLLPPRYRLIEVLGAVAKIAAEQEVIDKNSTQEYLGVFIEPIVDLVLNPHTDPEVKEVAEEILLKNLTELYVRRIKRGSVQEGDRKGLNVGLKRLEQRLREKSEFMQTIVLIEEIISGAIKK